MKNKFKKNSSPDFNKIQQTLATEWLERAKEEKLSDLPVGNNKKDNLIFERN